MQQREQTIYTTCTKGYRDGLLHIMAQPCQEVARLVFLEIKGREEIILNMNNNK